MEKLNKAFCNESWLSHYPYSYVFCMPIVALNHALIYIDINRHIKYQMHGFKFQNMWLTSETCNEIMKNAQTKQHSSLIAYQLIEILNETKRALIKWDKTYFR